MHDDHDDHIAGPLDFANEQFAYHNRALFDEYIQMRIHGIQSAVAFRVVFGESYIDNQTTARIYGLEKNVYYKSNFERILETTPVHKLWNPKIAVHELVSMVRDKFAKDSARLSAAKELNVLCGITIVDESGKTKAGRTLADFYAEQETKAIEKGEAPVEPTLIDADPAHTTH